MMKPVILSLALLACFACTPKITTNITSSRAPLNNDDYVAVLKVTDMTPAEAEFIGTVKFGDTGFTTECTYAQVIDLAKNRARAVGGNVVKLTEHRTPSGLGSSCHRIKADILLVADLSRIHNNPAAANEPEQDQALFDEGCCVVHFYRYASPGQAAEYDILAGDETICRTSNNFRESVKIKAVGELELRSSTVPAVGLTVDLQPGFHYYIRCGLSNGKPTLEAVSNKLGKHEYGNIRIK